jgi:hypothetical protein
MAYFIFSKNSDGIENTLYRIAENQSDLNNIITEQSSYKIIEDSQNNFDAVKYGIKNAISYNGNTISYLDISPSFQEKKYLLNYVTNYKNEINSFLQNNPNHPLIQKWSNYYTQLNNLNLDTINYPLNSSLEQYFNGLGQTSLNPLQLP